MDNMSLSDIAAVTRNVDGECPPDLCCCARRGKQGGNFGHYGNPGR